MAARPEEICGREIIINQWKRAMFGIESNKIERHSLLCGQKRSARTTRKGARKTNPRSIDHERNAKGGKDVTASLISGQFTPQQIVSTISNKKSWRFIPAIPAV
jgi:hypothetical protein